MGYNWFIGLFISVRVLPSSQERDSLETTTVYFEFLLFLGSMLGFEVRPERTCMHFINKMAGMEDFYSGEDLDAILLAIEDNILEDDELYAVPVNEVVEEVSAGVNVDKFSCDQCEKTCKTKRGLSRHKNTKHKDSVPGIPVVIPDVTPESKFHPLHLKGFIIKSASKLANDECYSEKTRGEFTNYEVTLDDAIFSYQFVRDIIGSFKGDTEKFYSSFYKCVSDVIVFRNLTLKDPQLFLVLRLLIMFLPTSQNLKSREML